LRVLNVRCSKVRKTKTEVLKWAMEKERDILLNNSTEEALKRNIVLTVHEALTRYSNEISRYKKLERKKRSGLNIFKSICRMLIGHW
jgi:hypothetical protein